MYALSLGVSQIGETLPAPVYALLSGLNAATVGIIALAAVQLAKKAITDKLTRALVFLGGVAGMLYTALWYFPVLMLGAGLATVVWDFRWIHAIFRPFWRARLGSRRANEEDSRAGETVTSAQQMAGNDPERSLHQRRIPVSEEQQVELSIIEATSASAAERPDPPAGSERSERIVPSNIQLKVIAWKTGIFIITGFFVSFVTTMVIRSLLKNPPRGVSLFANLYLAGTIIFGGGPVVIPLLREYIVTEGWVSPRDFLLGLALIQSFPGPNFNFAVYLGSLATAGSSLPTFGGAHRILGDIYAWYHYCDRSYGTLESFTLTSVAVVSFTWGECWGSGLGVYGCL